MSALMATDRVRTVLLLPEELRAALRLEAARRGVDMSDVAADVLTEALADSLKEVRERRQNEPKRKKPSSGN
jgi:plasmid stability protein